MDLALVSTGRNFSFLNRKDLTLTGFCN